MKCFIDKANATTLPLSIVRKPDYESWYKTQVKRVQNWLDEQEFAAIAGRAITVPDADGNAAFAVAIVARSPSLWDYAAIPSKLPARSYNVDGDIEAHEANKLALAWGLASYEFDRFRTKEKEDRDGKLVWPSNCDRKLVLAQVASVCHGRELVNLPANILGPAQLVAEVTALAKKYRGQAKVIAGAALLKQNYPLVHAVGRASSREPQLVDAVWGAADAPKVTIVGKGVIFDSGGLNLKPSQGMRLMKKDMGGAAAAIALAELVLEMRLPVRLRLIVPAVENSVSGDSYRPGDVIKSRKGLTVEIGDTDAEGRLVLGDALTLAAEEKPELIIDFATLTGAARVALGTELPALFCNRDDVAQGLLHAAQSVEDSLWRMPLWASYRRHLESSAADMCNISRVPEGGAITAALFLQEFVEKLPWIHIDTMGWNSTSQAGRPAGGEALAVRGVYAYLAQRFGNAASPAQKPTSLRRALKAAPEATQPASDKKTGKKAGKKAGKKVSQKSTAKAGARKKQ